MRVLDFNLCTIPYVTSALDLQSKLNNMLTPNLNTKGIDETAQTDIDVLDSFGYFGNWEINSTNTSESISTITNIQQRFPITINVITDTAFHFNTVTASNVSANHQIVFSEDFILKNYDRFICEYASIGGFDVVKVTSVNYVNSQRVIMTPVYGDLRRLNSVPIAIPIPAPGAGKCLIATKCYLKYVFNVNNYSYNYVAISHVADTFIADGHIYTRTLFWQSTSNLNTDMIEIDSVIANYKENEQMYLISDADDIFTGDCDVTFYIEYKILTL